MTEIEYLYGINEPDWGANTKVFDLYDRKIKLGKKLLSKLLDGDYISRDNQRVNDVIKGIRFNEKMLSELKGELKLRRKNEV